MTSQLVSAHRESIPKDEMSEEQVRLVCQNVPALVYSAPTTACNIVSVQHITSKQGHCSLISPPQLLSFTSKGLEGDLWFGEVLVPVVLHI